MDTKNIKKDLKSKISTPIILLLVAVVIAGVASVLVYGMLQKKAAAKTMVSDTQPIVVAGFDITWGTVLSKDLIKTEPYLKTSLPSGYIDDPQSAVGRVVLYPIQAGEPITESRLAPASARVGGLAAVVAPNKRAMGVKVDKVVGISGFIHPGNRVDVLVSLPKSERVPQSITKVVLENIPVLAVGAEVEQSAGKKEKAAPVDVITLEVTPEQGERLALAATEGKLQLALRNYADVQEVTTRGTTIPQMLTAHRAASEPEIKKQAMPVKRAVRARRAPAASSSGANYTVEIMKGTKVSEEKFMLGGE